MIDVFAYSNAPKALPWHLVTDASFGTVSGRYAIFNSDNMPIAFGNDSDDRRAMELIVQCVNAMHAAFPS